MNFEFPSTTNQNTPCDPGRIELKKVISGGQTGVDRAALDWAIEQKITCGGWCPQGRRAEDGVIDTRYPLQETPTWDYKQRTQWNVRDSDGTLILALGDLTGGTALTASYCRSHDKPLCVVDLRAKIIVVPVEDWMMANTITLLNIAGPRESTSPGIAQLAAEFLRSLRI